jgi:hypothetical protein
LAQIDRAGGRSLIGANGSRLVKTKKLIPGIGSFVRAKRKVDQTREAVDFTARRFGQFQKVRSFAEFHEI